MNKTFGRYLTCVVLQMIIFGIGSASGYADERSPEAKEPAAPGKLIDVGGYRLHIHCTGEGQPAVVFLYGGGAYSLDFSLVQPKVAKFTSACSYDRAGDAWSDIGPSPRTMRQNAYELHSLLSGAEIKGPYVLVGHSYGGILARIYARDYPEEVAGMVLVDSTHESTQLIFNDKVKRIRLLSSGKAIPPVRRNAAPTQDKKPTEKARPTPSDNKLDAPYNKLPPEAQSLRLWAQSLPRHPDMDYFPEELQEIYESRKKTTYPLGDIPLIVLSGAIHSYPEGLDVSADELTKEKKEHQADLLNLSRNSKQIIAKKSGHEIHLDEPDLVVAAIREVVDAVKERQALRKKLEAGCAKVAEAYRKKDIKMFMEGGDATPDFSLTLLDGKTLDGKTVTREQTEAAIKQKMDRIKSVNYLRVEIGDITVTGNTAVVITTQHFSRVITGPDGKEHTVVTSGTVHRETWVKTATGWKCKHIQETKQGKEIVDGEPAKGP
jgi:pimeloyl-ACP methyl ester carboxylesterase